MVTTTSRNSDSSTNINPFGVYFSSHQNESVHISRVEHHRFVAPLVYGRRWVVRQWPVIVPRGLQWPSGLVLVAIRRFRPRLVGCQRRRRQWCRLLVLVLGVGRFREPPVRLVTVVVSGILGSDTEVVVETLHRFEVTGIV